MPEKSPQSFRFNFLVFAGLVLLSLVLQWSSGGWQNDFGGHADEGAHVVTSLMMRDYLVGGWMEHPNPFAFAEHYYERFPKVAIGHYPPGFYALASLPLSIFRSSNSLYILMAVLSAGVGWMTWRMAEKVLDRSLSSIAVAILVCSLPLVRTYTVIVMADLALVLFCLLSVEAFGRYLGSGKAMDSLAFGCWAAAAILTKASGLCLALVPPIAIFLIRDWKKLRDPRLWLAPVPVLLLAFPWMWATRDITSEGMMEADLWTYVREAIPFYFRGIVDESGALMTALLLLCLFLFVFRRRLFSRQEGENLLASMAAFAIASLFLLVILTTGFDRRYLLPVLPCCLMLGGWTAEQLVRNSREFVRLIAVPAACLISLVLVWRPVKKVYTGATEVVEIVLEHGSIPGSQERIGLLVVTDARGEGALTASAALLGRDSLVVERGSKLLASSDWLGRGYEKTFATELEFRELLHSSGVDFVVVEQPNRGQVVSEHWAWVADQMRSEGEVAEVVSYRLRGQKSAFLIYRSPEIEEEARPQSAETIRN